MAKASQRASGGQSGTRRTASQRSPREPDGTVLQEALRRADEAWSAERENVSEGRDCQRFYAGDQWDAKAKESRQKRSRPVLVINRLPQFVRQMTGDVRKNPPSLKFLPAKGEASQDTAEAYNGIARHIEQQSQAKDCYVKAVENAAQAGQGFFRVVTEYSSDDGFELDIRIRPILDPFGALIDPFAQLFDKSDMKYAFVFEHLTVKDFQKEWPGKAVVDAPRGDGDESAKAFPWRVSDTIRVAEYWRRVPVKKKLYLLADGATVDALPEGMEAENERDVDAFKVEMYRITGADVLSGPHEWAGRFIPLCMVVGEEISMDGSTARKGMVHDARDPQRIYNYSRSASVEAVALQPKAPFVGTVDMFKGRPEWQTAGSENHAFLAYNPDHAAGPGAAPVRSQPAIASEGMDRQAIIADNDMKAVTGIYDAALGNKSNETSGVAIRNRQQEGDTATYLYPDNLGRAIGYLGKILADLIPRVYDNERQVRILKEDGTADMITVNQTIPQEEGKPLYDLSAGEYDVTVTTGPSFATQRAEAAANMIEMARAWPQLFPIAGDLFIKNMDWPGVDELAKRVKMALNIPEDGEQPRQPPPDPKTVASALKDGAATDKLVAETESIKIDSATKVLQLETMMAQIGQGLQQIQAFMAALSGQGGPQQPGGPPMAPRDAMPPDGPPMAPQGLPPPQPNGADNGLPMVELDSVPEGAPV